MATEYDHIRFRDVWVVPSIAAGVMKGNLRPKQGVCYDFALNTLPSHYENFGQKHPGAYELLKRRGWKMIQGPAPLVLAFYNDMSEETLTITDTRRASFSFGIAGGARGSLKFAEWTEVAAYIKRPIRLKGAQPKTQPARMEHR